MQGKWCLLVEEQTYREEGRTLLEFRDGVMIDGDGAETPYQVVGNSIRAQLADQVTIEINPGDIETGAPGRDLADDVGNVQANVTTSFGDGSDDMVEYASLIRETD